MPLYFYKDWFNNFEVKAGEKTLKLWEKYNQVDKVDQIYLSYILQL